MLPHPIPSSELAAPFAVRRLTLTNFRNYKQLRLELEPQPVVLTGSNGAGKTNLLEAVSYLAPGRGLRGAALGEVGLQFTPESFSSDWAVAAEIDSPLGQLQLGTGLDTTKEKEKRVLRIEGKRARGQSDWARACAVLWLTPQMDGLLRGSAGDRRRFFDRLVYGLYPEHASHIAAYEQAMRERNRLLSENSGDSAWLTALEQTMAENGLAIASSRLDVVERLNQALSTPSSSHFPQARVALEGEVEHQLASGLPALTVEEQFKTRLVADRRRDGASGRTAAGTHRSDLLVYFITEVKAAERPAGLCSTGEQKALLLSLMLAQLRTLTRWRGAAPILLLDEVVAHLDEARRLALFDALCETQAQVWMTGTEAALFSPLESRAQIGRVENGKVTF